MKPWVYLATGFIGGILLVMSIGGFMLGRYMSMVDAAEFRMVAEECVSVSQRQDAHIRALTADSRPKNGKGKG